MEELKEFVKHHQSIIAAVIAGTCAIIAAFIRRDRTQRQPHETKPIFKLVLLSIFSMVLGAGLLGAEMFVLPADPALPLNLDNPGAIVQLAGCLFLAAGLVWAPINLLRLRTAKQEGKKLASVPVNPGGVPASLPVVQPVAKRKA
jgi:putative flippase GtrA